MRLCPSQLVYYVANNSPKMKVVCNYHHHYVFLKAIKSSLEAKRVLADIGTNSSTLAQTIMTSSWPQNRKRYWSIIVCTMSSRCGRIASNFERSPNSYCSSVGHQQIARFLLSMQLSLLCSVTLSKDSKHQKTALNLN